MRIALVLWALVLVGCGGGGDDVSGPGQADYTPPTWALAVDRSEAHGPGGEAVPTPTDAEVLAEYNRVTSLWLAYWHERSNGTWRGMSAPPETLYARVTIDHVYSTSCDDLDGAWGAKVRGWSYTHNRPRPIYGDDGQLSAICHGLSHQISGLSGGSAAHSTFAAVCGC